MRPYFCLWPLLFQLLPASTLANDHKSAQPRVHTVDVAIIGGGAAGTYAAVKLSKDYNISIVLIEPRDHLGGSVSTYVVPGTNTTLEFGVQSYLRYDPTTDFFARFGISTRPSTTRRLTPLMVDVETGAQLKDYIVPSSNATNEALQRWLSLVSKYESALEPGYWAFPQPADIPFDFLMPFRDFVKLHQLEAAVPRIMTISGVGTGGVGDLLTLDVMQAFGPSLTRHVLDASFIVLEGSNSLIYQRAREVLGPDVLLSSTVQSVERNWTGSKLTVRQGNIEYIVNTKRILFTAPASPSVLKPF